MTRQGGKRSPPPVTGRASYDRLRPAERAARKRALDAVARMRSAKVPLRVAATAAGTTPATVLRYAPSALTRQGRGYTVAPTDRLYRRMAVLTANGRAEVDVHSSGQARRVAAHWNAVDAYARTGDQTVLAPFRRTRVGGQLLLTDPDGIERWATRGELSIDEIYPHR